MAELATVKEAILSYVAIQFGISKEDVRMDMMIDDIEVLATFVVMNTGRIVMLNDIEDNYAELLISGIDAARAPTLSGVGALFYTKRKTVPREKNGFSVSLRTVVLSADQQFDQTLAGLVRRHRVFAFDPSTQLTTRVGPDFVGSKSLGQGPATVSQDEINFSLAKWAREDISRLRRQLTKKTDNVQVTLLRWCK